jgi:tRNA A-37 threonylcarbamoyl transferase component Bud32
MSGTIIGEAVYKTVYPPGYGGPATFHRRARSLRDQLSRSPDLTERLHRRAVPRGIRPARVLAVDPDGLTLITERVPGTALGNSLHQAITPRGRASALSIAERIGRSVRLIESVAGEEEIEEPKLSLPVVEEQIDAARDMNVLSDDESARLMVVMRGLYREARTGDGVVYTHGDLTRTNVLRTDEGIALIDFSWRPQLRSYDLAKFAVLLESVPFRRPAWTASLIERAVEGYGDSEDSGSPGWRFVRLQQRLRVAMRLQRPSSRRRRSHRRIAQRALAGIRSELS